MKNQSHIKTVSFHTLGCKLNQSETDAIAADFKRNGFEIVPFRSAADLTVINTCTVTNEADSKSRQIIRNAIKASPQGRIVAMGCYAQINPEDLSAINGIDMVLGTNEKYRLLEYITQLETKVVDKPLVYVNESGDIENYRESEFISATGRTRAYLKIQEGCDYFCSYCIIPFARGKARSRQIVECLAEAKSLVDRGYRELVLTGINIGTWQDGSNKLVDLLDSLSIIPGLDRIRISSIEPNTISDDILHLLADRPTICPHLHIPLQSGSPEVLNRMRRKYQLTEYFDLADRIGNIVPDVAWGTDLIVGFPGETEAEFAETLAVVEQLPFSYLHIFRYSERDGTIAAKLPNRVDFHVKKKRASILREMGAKKKQVYNRRFLNTVQPVLFEMVGKDDLVSGMTPNYIRVKIAGDESFKNKICQVHLTKDCSNYLIGEISEQP